MDTTGLEENSGSERRNLAGARVPEGERAPGERDPGERDEARQRLAPGQPDPTMMINQPALQKSQGTVWTVMGGLFLAASLIAFGAMVTGGSGESSTLAVVCAVVVTLLYIVLFAARFAVADKKFRLKVMAACMLTMAFISLVGLAVCALIEGAAVVT